MNEFVNPYHFCPVVAGQRQGDMDVADFDKRKAKFVSHARYAPDTFSGRVVCRLTTEDAVFIGKEIVREPSESEPGQVAPFELDRRPAIPASSLRGLISSIAEAASNSSLRILQNTMYSYRQELATQSLSAIGMVVKENGEFRLRPLTLPTIKVDGHRQDASLQAPELEGYRPMFPIPNLKVYFGNESSIRAHDFPYQTLDVGAPKFYYMQVEMAQWADAPTRRKAWSPKEHRKNIKNRFEFLLGQDSPDAWPLPEKTWSALPPKRKRLYTRGIVRVLGCGPGREDIPETKKHEVFIPCPENFVYLPTFPIPQAVVDRFEMLADDRTEARKDGEPLPYSPVGTTRGDSSNPRKLRLKHGDLVYFRPTRNGEAVSEISFSSVWRGRVERRDSQSIPERPETTYDFFRAVDPELLPFNPRRQKITIAEQLFGFVEELESNADRPARALAGKIRFSHGLLHQFRKADYSNWSRESGMETPYDAPVTLKILDSPKPPCPALYFKTASRPHHAVSARELAPGACQPQGRKFYIHRRGAQDEPKQPWKHTPREGEKQTQHMEVIPLKSGNVFYFHVDFDNLTELDLGLLCYALRPDKSYRHHIGMGKPIGMGKVKIDPVALYLVDRKLRYSYIGLIEKPRYHKAWFAAEGREQWPTRYSGLTAADQALSPDDFRAAFDKSMVATIRDALHILGRTSAIPAPVHTPAALEQGHFPEEETFQWFVANQQRRQPVFLPPLDDSNGQLPTLPMDLTEEPHSARA